MSNEYPPENQEQEHSLPVEQENEVSEQELQEALAAETAEQKEALVTEKKAEIEAVAATQADHSPEGEVERFDVTHVTIPEDFQKPKENWLASKWKKAMVTLGLAGAMAIPAAAKEGGEDTLARKSFPEKTISVAKKSEAPVAKPAAAFETGKKATKEGLMIRPLSAQERQDWNDFLDFVKAQGYEGSEKLNTGSDALARKLFAEYKKLHPETTMEYGIVASVQHDMQQLKENVQSFAKRKNDPNAENLMKDASKVDGWFGSQTSKYKYPQMLMNTFHNNDLISSKNLGLVDGTMQTQKSGVQRPQQKIPEGAKVEQLKGGKFYEDPQTGDLIEVRE